MIPQPAPQPRRKIVRASLEAILQRSYRLHFWDRFTQRALRAAGEVRRP